MILWSGVSDLAQTYEERIDLRRMMKRVIGGTPSSFRNDTFFGPRFIMRIESDVRS